MFYLLIDYFSVVQLPIFSVLLCCVLSALWRFGSFKFVYCTRPSAPFAFFFILDYYQLFYFILFARQYFSSVCWTRPIYCKSHSFALGALKYSQVHDSKTWRRPKKTVIKRGGWSSFFFKKHSTKFSYENTTQPPLIQASGSSSENPCLQHSISYNPNSACTSRQQFQARR